jgi:formate dehydrogenase (coenzyme F420) beta subunit
MVHLEDIKKEARRLLEEGTVKFVVGYKRGFDGLTAIPAFVDSPEDVEQLIWEATCVHNLARFLVDERRLREREKHNQVDKRPVAIIAKGCDTRTVNVLLQEKYIRREDVYIIGVSCEHTGVADLNKISRRFKVKKAERVKFDQGNQFLVRTKSGNIKVPAEEFMADRCRECKANFPVVYDVVFGDQVNRTVPDFYRTAEPVERMAPGERWEFWKKQMDKCIRCYACRSVCPMCYCEECVVDSINFAVNVNTTADEKAQKIKWIERSASMPENTFYHLIRALHLAGRCIDCGECQRVCPVDIPIRILNKKMEKEAQKRFGYESGFDPDQPSLVSSFKDDDPQDFIL